jgi:polysaccharide pyruvyl transferase WcaK-like protein
MRLLLFPHGGSGNHGCEAIVRSTGRLSDKEIVLFSDRVKEDLRYGLDSVCELRRFRQPIDRMSLKYAKAWLSFNLFSRKKAFDGLVYSDFLKSVSSDDLVLSIGGDNYCYGRPERLYFLDDEIRKKARMVLWGCSIEPSLLDARMLEDLNGFSRIIARESLTFNLLKESGLKNVSLFPDPAFGLARTATRLPDGFIDGNMVGINISPMVIGLEKSPGIVLDNCCKLIEHIISGTDMNVALIPHVVWNHNDDSKPLGDLFNRFKGTGRVIMIEDRGAEELKDVIARCRFLIAARTHASIAAYSTMVPTVVIGYSVKAKGIGRDIFGTYDNYVIPVQDITDADKFTGSFDWLCQNETVIRARYDSFMPSYVSRLDGLREILEELC